MVFIRQKTITVDRKSSGERLDRFLSRSVENISRTLVQRLIENESIKVNDKNEKSGYKVRENDKIFISIPEPSKASIEAEKIKLDVVFEDNDLIVINKPQGMVTHPASNVYKGTLVNALLYHCKDSLSGINGVLRPGIVHRLDKETSGLIIACKNDKAHNEIARQLKEREIKKYYYALVHGKVEHNQGKINRPIGRDKIHRHRMAIVQGGKAAVTHWKVLERKNNFTVLECNLETGRTHQIRVHMKSIGHPIIGDKTYGKKSDSSNMMLHAYKLIFIHPTSKKSITLETKMPERFKEFMDGCKIE